MSRDVHLPGPPADLLSAASDVAFVWLVRITKQAFGNANCSWESAADEIDAMAVVESERLIEELAGLMSTDVDEQRTNPLSVFRNAVAGPTGLLGRCGIAQPDSAASGQFVPTAPVGRMLDGHLVGYRPVAPRSGYRMGCVEGHDRAPTAA